VNILLTEDELEQLTGYRQHAAQLRELHRQGFWRARRRDIDGRVVLERAHYEAICEAPSKAAKHARPAPLLASERKAA
jgi:hypothetical protein